MTADRFTVAPWRVHPEQSAVTFAYDCEPYGPFSETVHFPIAAAALAKLASTNPAIFDLAAGILGVSYYKAAPKPVFRPAGAPGPAGQALLEALYTDGLGEFCVRNALPFPPRFSLDVRPSLKSEVSASKSPHAPARAVVAFGGGKDSHVASRLVKQAGLETEVCAISLSDQTQTRLAKLNTSAVTALRRAIDPRLLAANKAGALNGHVPITAINSVLLMIYAASRHADWVVFANEKGAEEPTLIHQGHPINHQFSKTYRCETLMRAAFVEAMPSGPEYFSILRPTSELWIAQRLAKTDDALQVFSSCNRNFVFSGPTALPSGARWCGACAKCVFTSLITAPFLGRAQSTKIFEHDVLAAASNLTLLRDIVGLSAAKPWDCVGAVREAAAALILACDHPDWMQAFVLRETRQAVADAWGEARLREAAAIAMMPGGPHHLPPAAQTVVFTKDMTDG